MDDMRKVIHNLRDQMHIILMALEVNELQMVEVAARKAVLILELLSVRQKEKQLLEDITTHEHQNPPNEFEARLQGGNAKGRE